MAPDGGPVFPCSRMETTTYRPSEGEPREIEVQVTYPGISLRDYFAGQALITLAGAFVERYTDDDQEGPPGSRRQFSLVEPDYADDVTDFAYELADSMLRARALKQEAGEQ